ncbi:family 43 glycosylhydrolase [Pseudoduganella sp. UC29_106]|uniref:family 43 glycosylhydrolase n=1 Tax=Pseudoduganella sp. UC29_106 TaxID=3374553 RepID=UPI0037568093
MPRLSILCVAAALHAGGVMAQELGIPQASDAARQAARGTAVGAQDQPVYLMPGFTAASPGKLSLFASTDGATFTTLASETYTAPERMLRDPSIIRHSDGYYYLVYASSENGAAFGTARSRDLKSWQAMGEIKVAASGFAKARAPEWLRDKDGILKLVVSLSSNGATGAYILEPNAGFSQWSEPKPLAGLQGYVDSFIVASDKGYAAFVRNQQTGYIELASAQALTGPWTVEKKGDWAGWDRAARDRPWCGCRAAAGGCISRRRAAVTPGTPTARTTSPAGRPRGS